MTACTGDWYVSIQVTVCKLNTIRKNKSEAFLFSLNYIA